jgi:hypothetical protein
MNGLLLLLLNLYLGVFSSFAVNRVNARRENSLLFGGIEYLFEEYLGCGMSTQRAYVQALWDYLGELQPIALYQKTRADAERIDKDASLLSLRRLPQNLGLALAVAILGVAVLIVLVVLCLLSRKDDTGR